MKGNLRKSFRRLGFTIFMIMALALIAVGDIPAAASSLDYDVTHISQNPKYFKYSLYEIFDRVGYWGENSGIPFQTPGTENEKRWPQAGEPITYTAHVVNKGTIECPPFQYRWLINGTEVNRGAYAHSIPPGYVAPVDWAYPWPAMDHTDHSKDTITFEVLNSDDLPQNNKRTDYLAALSLSIWVDSGQYQAFNQKKNFTGTYSFEDWVQWQVQTMNERFAQATYEGVAPGGILERVRIDKIVVAEHVTNEMPKDPDARTTDGRWQFTGEGPQNYENYANQFAENMDWGLMHEIAHQLGVIDLYRLSLGPKDNHIPNDEGPEPLNIGMTPFNHPGIMAGGDTSPHNDGSYFSSHDAGFLNTNLGYRRGYYGEYLYDIPRNNYIRVLDNQGNPVPDAQVTVYQVATPANRYLSQPMPKGTRVVKVYKNASIFHPGMPVTIAGPDEFFTTVESINAATQEITLADPARIDFGMGSNINRFGGVPGKAKFTGKTDASGLFLIPNEEPYRTITTATKHTLRANPFGTINVVGTNAILYFKVKARGQTDIFDLNITDFNRAYWSGQKENFTYTYQSRVPPAVAPQPPMNLEAKIEREKVSLTWEPPSSGNFMYNVYRAAYPNFRYQKITPSPVSSPSFLENVDVGLNLRYAVTAVDSNGNESRLSNFVVKPLMVIPYKIAVNSSGERFITDPHPHTGWMTKQNPEDQFQNFWIREYGRVTGVAVDSRNRVVAAASGGPKRILIYDPVSGHLLNQGAGEGSQPGQLLNPQAIVVDGEDRIYVADTDNHRIQVFRSDFSLFAAYGSNGNSNGQFDKPAGIALDGTGRILVADTNNHRVQILSFDKGSGTIFYQKTLIHNFSYPNDVAVDGGDNIYVCDTGNSQIVKFNSNGDFLEVMKPLIQGNPQSISGPRGIAVDRQHNLLVIADTNNRRIVTVPLQPISQFVIMASAGTGGTINPQGSVTVNSGASQIFTITPNGGYRILDVKVDGESKGATNTLTIANVTTNHTVQATFSPVSVPQPQVVFAVNCGGTQYTDKSGIIYKADVNFSGGMTYKTTAPIDQTEDDLLYQSERWGKFSYNIPVANGNYNLTLKFAELYCSTAQCRVFNVKVEGKEVLTNLDVIAKAGGKNRPYNFTTPVTVADGVLTIEFYNSANNAKVNGILVTSGQPISQYAITASAGAGGTITPSGTVSVPSGGTQAFTITPKGGYQILDVKVDGESKGATNTLTIANVTSNHTVEATFSQAADPVVTASAGVGGTILPSGKVATHWGMMLNFAMNANTGYRIADVKVDGVSQGAISYYTFQSVTANHTIEASFVQQGSGPQVVLAVKCGGPQYTDKSGVVYKADVNFSGGQTYQTTAPIAGTSDGPLYQSERWGNFSYNLPVTNGNYNVTLKFAELYCSTPGCRVFSVKVEGKEVLTNLDVISKAGGKNRAYDVTVPVTVSDGVLNIEFYNAAKNAKVNAILVTSGQPVSQYTITASAGAGGTISPSGTVSVPAGGTQSFLMTANAGYRIADVRVDGESKGATNTITIANVTATHTVQATFSAIPSPLTITATAGQGGTISPSGQVTVAYGGQQTFIISPSSGYGIDQVIVDGVSKGSISSYTFANVTANHTITPSFKPQPAGPIGCTTGGIPSDYYDELCTPHTLPVLVINYIPVGTSVDSTTVLRGQQNDSYAGNAQIHCQETGIPDGCVNSGARMLARSRLPLLKNGANLTAAFLTEGTRFHGYKDPNAPPALTFPIVDTVTILQKQDYQNDPLWPNTLGYRRGSPLGNNEYRDPFRYIFETADVCRYVKDQGVRLVFYNTYFFHGSIPAESFSAGPFGNVGNSEGGMGNYIAYCRNGSPVSTPQEADVTYHAIGYHPTEGTFAPGNAIEDFTHHLEALFRLADYDIWQNHFVGPEGHLDRAYMGWWVPGLLPGQYFNDSKVINTWGLKIWLDALHVPGDRSAQLHIEPVPNVNPPARNWPPGDSTPNVKMNVPFTIASDATVALEGKDIKINYWENGGKAFFNVYRPSADYAVVRRCGWTHFPPNGEGDYNWGNGYWRVRADCEDWYPDQSGEILPDVDCRRWAVLTSATTCSHDPNPSANYMGADLGFKKWWMQNFPGLDNGLIWNESGQTRHVRNFWYYLTDYHRAIQKNSKLSFVIQRIESSAPTGLNLARAGNGISLTWTAPQNGTEGYNVFRAASQGGPFYRVNNQLVTTTIFLDDFVLNPGTTYYYDVRSVKQVQSETGVQGSITFQ